MLSYLHCQWLNSEYRLCQFLGLANWDIYCFWNTYRIFIYIWYIYKCVYNLSPFLLMSILLFTLHQITYWIRIKILTFMGISWIKTSGISSRLVCNFNLFSKSISIQDQVLNLGPGNNFSYKFYNAFYTIIHNTFLTNICY